MKNIYSLFLVFLFSVVMKAEVSVSEKSALINLYNATNGANWKAKWDLNAPVSSWYGVKLLNDKVVAIQYPIGQAETFEGIVDLILMKAFHFDGNS